MSRAAAGLGSAPAMALVLAAGLVLLPSESAAHLELRSVLSEGGREAYDRMRGYRD